MNRDVETLTEYQCSGIQEWTTAWLVLAYGALGSMPGGTETATGGLCLYCVPRGGWLEQ